MDIDADTGWHRCRYRLRWTRVFRSQVLVRGRLVRGFCREVAGEQPGASSEETYAGMLLFWFLKGDIVIRLL